MTAREDARYGEFVARYPAYLGTAALDELRARFDRTDTWLETREEVRHVLVAARDVAGVMRRGPFGRPLAVEWRRLRADLNTLAGVYDLPKL